MINKPSQTLIEELYRIDGKAEIVGGEIVLMSPTGNKPSWAGGKIFASLLAHEEANPGSGGVAFPDNMGFLVDLPNRKSFSLDAAYWFG